MPVLFDKIGDYCSAETDFRGIDTCNRNYLMAAIENI